jgi:hypothetical protein
MRGQRIFAYISRFVFIIFYLVVLSCFTNIGIRTYCLVKGDTDLAGVWHLDPLCFDVKSFSSFENPIPQFPYWFSKGKLAALQQAPDQYLMYVGHKSPIGYYDYFLAMLLTAASLCGIWQLRSIFRSISIEVPFAAPNVRCIRNIGLLLIGSDIVKLIHYMIFNAMASKYFIETELQTQIGDGIWIGSLLLALSVVYRRGVEIYSNSHHPKVSVADEMDTFRQKGLRRNPRKAGGP